MNVGLGLGCDLSPAGLVHVILRLLSYLDASIIVLRYHYSVFFVAWVLEINQAFLLLSYRFPGFSKAALAGYLCKVGSLFVNRLLELGRGRLEQLLRRDGRLHRHRFSHWLLFRHRLSLAHGQPQRFLLLGEHLQLYDSLVRQKRRWPLQVHGLDAEFSLLWLSFRSLHALDFLYHNFLFRLLDESPDLLFVDVAIEVTVMLNRNLAQGRLRLGPCCCNNF